MKALVAEMVGNFSKRLNEAYGINVRELTGEGLALFLCASAPLNSLLGPQSHALGSAVVLELLLVFHLNFSSSNETISRPSFATQVIST